MSTKLAFLFFSLFLGSALFAQTAASPDNKKSAASIGLEGTLGISVGENLVALNVGGPSFAVRLNPNWKVGVMALPSVYFRQGKAGTRLGVAPRVQYKKVSFILPLYEFNTVWYLTAGLSYQFSK